MRLQKISHDWAYTHTRSLCILELAKGYQDGSPTERTVKGKREDFFFEL